MADSQLQNACHEHTSCFPIFNPKTILKWLKNLQTYNSKSNILINKFGRESECKYKNHHFESRNKSYKEDLIGTKINYTHTRVKMYSEKVASLVKMASVNSDNNPTGGRQSVISFKFLDVLILAICHSIKLSPKEDAIQRS